MTTSAVNQADLFTWNSQTSVVDDNDYIRNKACEVLGQSFKTSNSSTSYDLPLSNNQSLLAVTTAESEDHRSLSRRSTPANLNQLQSTTNSSIARTSQSTNQQQQQRFNINSSTNSSSSSNQQQPGISSRHNISSAPSSSSITPPPTGSRRMSLQAQTTSRPASACLPTAHKNVSPLSNSATSQTLSHTSHLKTFKANQTTFATKNEPIKSINKRTKEPITLEEIFQVKKQKNFSFLYEEEFRLRETENLHFFF